MASLPMRTPTLEICTSPKLPPVSCSRLRNILPVGGSAHWFPRLKLRQETATAVRPSVAVRAQSHHGFRGKPNHFITERNLIALRCADTIIRQDKEGCLYHRATLSSSFFCSLAATALDMASLVVESSSLNLGAPNEISTETVHMTLHVYVNTFLNAAEDSYNRRVETNTVRCFFGALGGVASVSQILLETALEALSHVEPKESLPEYALNKDVKALRREFDWKIRDLEGAFWKATTCESMVSTVSEGVTVLESFVNLTLARRKRALEKARAHTK